MESLGIGITEKGDYRQRNEDAFFADNAIGLYVVSDGMGGRAAGDVASRMAVQAVARYVYTRRDLVWRLRAGKGDESMLVSLATAAVTKACEEVYEAAFASEKLRGMGCTLTVLLVGHKSAALAHVGDSRLYRLRRGRVCQFTMDHTLMDEYVRWGLLDADEARKLGYDHVLTQAVGTKASVSIDRRLFPVEPGDSFLLCTDGLSGVVSESELERLLAKHSPESAPRRLIHAATVAGSTDNITAVVVYIPDDASRRPSHSDSSPNLGRASTAPIEHRA